MDPGAPDLSSILDTLEARYGAQKWTGPRDPFQMLVLLYCGYPASDAACAKGFDRLQHTAGVGVDEILSASNATLLAAMRAGGIMAEQRVERIQHLAQIVKHEYHGDLAGAVKSSLAAGAHDPDAGIRRAKKLLQEFPSVGEPGAEKLLLFAKLAPVAAVPSAHVDVCSRLWRGRTGTNYAVEYRAARDILGATVPAAFAPRQRAYLLLKRHGEEICKRSAPRCEMCPLTGRCAYIREMAKD
jgi:endonuclease III